ncbi:hypothetical protein EKN79_13805 [Enterobacter bugandensis]|jgi:hypothetical protein|nr:hypothetical protein EKN79_13805 [Enterobacter bugandensis]
MLWFSQDSELSSHSRGFRSITEETFEKQIDKKRPNTIPVFGPGKWLLGESRALKVGINAG